jgi:hypothetical protein
MALLSTRRGICARVRPQAASSSSDQSRAAHVQPQGAGGVGGLADLGTAELQAQPVLGQQHAGDASEQRRLMATQPQQLGGGEAGHGQVAGHRVQHRRQALELGALGVAATVVPEDGRAQRPVVGIEQHRAVHLPRKTDGTHLRPGLRQALAQRRHRAFGGRPPVGRLLLGPQRLGSRQLQGRRGLADHLLRVVEQQQLDLGGAQIDAEEHQASSPPSAGKSGRVSR